MIYVKYLDENGYDYQREKARKLGLVKDNIYELINADVGSSSSTIDLKGFEKHRFNSVMFDYFNEDMNEIDLMETRYNPWYKDDSDYLYECENIILDYRLGKIVEFNFNKYAYVAPECYIQVFINEDLDKIYKYKYIYNNEILNFSVSAEQVNDSEISFREMVDIYLIENNFPKGLDYIDKVLYLSKESIKEINSL